MTTIRETMRRDIQIPIPEGTLDGILVHPANTKGMILFAHGSGSGRLSPRNQFVAEHLNHGGFSTLLFDLLTGKEEVIDQRTGGHLRFDLQLLAGRLVCATDWLRDHLKADTLPFGYFGASTGAGAALIAAAQRPDVITAVVSRGGRPDLAEAALKHVEAPTLLIVGEYDPMVLEFNRKALKKLSIAKLEIVPGATHLFEEAGTLEKVAGLAQKWFEGHMAEAEGG